MKSLISLFVLAAFGVLDIAAQNSTALNQKHFNLEKNVALDGYDPVAYFTNNKPIKGKSSIQTKSEGITYYFSSEKNKDLFNQNPSKYRPEYGGWCAYAMGKTGEKVEVNPETYKVINGKLYLYYNAFFNNTLTDWNKDEAALKTKADKNWKSIYH
jgi:YHS domain-containing protein